MLETPQDCSIHTIDSNWLNQPRYTAVYVLQGPDGLAMVETGSFASHANVIAGMNEAGFDPQDVKDVFVSHIHLDHAGAAWWWAQQGARIHVHEFGAKHLIDPSVLLTSATRIYGERMKYLWGAVEPIDESRVNPVHGGDVVEAAGVAITALETPGHARHHHAFALTTKEHGKTCFTGDIGAMIMPEGDYLAVPSPPPEFDLEIWLASLKKLEAQDFDAIFPTHFGIHREPNRHFQRLTQALTEHAEFVGELMDKGVTRDDIHHQLVEWQRTKAVAMGTPDHYYQDYVVAHLMDMNVSGMMRYWSKRREAQGQ